RSARLSASARPPPRSAGPTHPARKRAFVRGQEKRPPSASTAAGASEPLGERAPVDERHAAHPSCDRRRLTNGWPGLNGVLTRKKDGIDVAYRLRAIWIAGHRSRTPRAR